MDKLRELPSVDQVLRMVDHLGLPHAIVTQQVRTVLKHRREAMQAHQPLPEHSVELEVSARLKRLIDPSLRHVINATGVILHTNLGRAPSRSFNHLLGTRTWNMTCLQASEASAMRTRHICWKRF